MAIVNKGAWVARNATVVGDVILEENASVWYGAVLRGDRGTIQIGEGSNVQDNCVIHEHTIIGKHCTIGHGAIVHGCTMGDHSMVGMGAIVLTGAKIGSYCLIGAGAVVTSKMDAPDGSLILGSPAKIIKEISPEMRAEIEKDAAIYVQLAAEQL